jgi:hypothetical protein
VAGPVPALIPLSNGRPADRHYPAIIFRRRRDCATIASILANLLADPRMAAAATLLACLILLLLARWIAHSRAHRRAVFRSRRALAGESAAEELLAEAGYRIDATQIETEWTILQGGEPVTILLRCDALVSRDGRRLVAEVKTGERAPSLTTAATRRQLLEYAVAYGADGALLVDPEAGAIHEIDFELATTCPRCRDRRSSLRSMSG